MDTLFRLVSLQQSSDQPQQHSNSTTSTSSRSSKIYHHHHHQQQQQQNYYYTQNPNPNNNPNNNHLLVHSSSQEEEDQQEECYNNPHPYMDEDHFSSSSNPNPNPNPTFNPSSSSSAAADFSLPHNLDALSSSSSTTDLLHECARCIVTRNSTRLQQLMWMLNELTSPYGDVEQKLAHCFLQALFARLTSSGPRTLRTLSSASDRAASFDSTRRTALRFQELSPWSSFGHVAANGAILESFLDGSQQLHILDISNTFCTQWPTLLEALATRSSDDTPHLTITTVVSSVPHRVMKEIGARMEKFARLMGVPFKFNIVHASGDLSELDLESLNLGTDHGSTVLAVNCINALRTVSVAGGRRDGFIARIARLRPRVVTVVEEEADLDMSDQGLDEDQEFMKGFGESFRFFSSYFDSLEDCFPKTSNERLSLERGAGRAIVDLVACSTAESTERRSTASGWTRRLRGVAGMSPARFSDDVADDVRALLRRYREGWGMVGTEEGGAVLTWKEQAVVWASAWRV